VVGYAHFRLFINHSLNQLIFYCINIKLDVSLHWHWNSSYATR